MPFQLERPLISLDLETTGINPSIDRIIEIGIISLYPDGREKEWSSFINPGFAIPAEVSEATKSKSRPHGITTEMVKHAPEFRELAPNIAHGMRDVDFVTYNGRMFDIPLLHNELRRAGVESNILNHNVVDAMKFYHQFKKRTLSDFIKDYLDEEHEDAHGALPDARNTLRAMIALMDRHELPRTARELHQLMFGNVGNKLAGGKFEWKGDHVVITFGKHANTPLNKVPNHYIDWVLRSDFPPEVKHILSEAKSGRYPTRPSEAQRSE